MNRSQLLKRLDQTWNAFTASYADLSDAEITEPTVTGTWSIKDIIVHVATWEAESLEHLPIILAGGRPPRYSVMYGGIDAFNARTTELTRNVSIAEALGMRDVAHRRLINFILTVPEDQFIRETGFRRRLRLDTYGHYPRHTAAIQRWRQRRAER
ncbi:MAG: DinB family protein [Acidobacteria bacterium]|nr:DinB family protein [Acidobacteriota bacterium]